MTCSSFWGKYNLVSTNMPSDPDSSDLMAVFWFQNKFGFNDNIFLVNKATKLVDLLVKVNIFGY